MTRRRTPRRNSRTKVVHSKARRIPRHKRPSAKAHAALESAAYNEGRIAAIMGEDMCPYMLPESRRQWKAGWRDQKLSGPVALAGEGAGE